MDLSRNSQGHSALRPFLEVQLAYCEARFIEAVCVALAEIQEHATQNMAEAQRRLEAGTYGFCLDCLTQIRAERLSPLSVAVRCAGCERRRSARIADEVPDLALKPPSRTLAGRHS